ncbi:hypothetical protein QO010_000099 [Caulobacter ginsengisoli]|uniref:Uncharacterized protein n=1 Tax=Caulobacter ginsengisoli TaxID=400775 RepID=A0ABU0IK11_9CAUL|nr:hypothetical protein [Caulobacter ginsengisoli]MDQ0462351.1 hypothetical protein [Caulobacter ginsengisoli]
MTIRKTLAAATAAVFFAGSALAQTPEAPPAAAAPAVPVAPAPPSPEEVAKARAIAEAVIGRLNISDLFENATDDAIPTIRHKASGMSCWVGADTNAEDVKIFDGLPRGDDVGCSDNIVEITRSLYATRYPQRPTAEQIVASSIQAMKQNFKRMKPYEGPGVSLMREDTGDLPKVTTARFTAVLNGQKVYTRTSAVVIGDWVFAQRVTAPEERAMAAEIMAELQLVMLLISVDGKQL